MREKKARAGRPPPPPLSETLELRLVSWLEEKQSERQRVRKKMVWMKALDVFLRVEYDTQWDSEFLASGGWVRSAFSFTTAAHFDGRPQSVQSYLMCFARRSYILCG